MYDCRRHDRAEHMRSEKTMNRHWARIDRAVDLPMKLQCVASRCIRSSTIFSFAGTERGLYRSEDRLGNWILDSVLNPYTSGQSHRSGESRQRILRHRHADAGPCFFARRPAVRSGEAAGRSATECEAGRHASIHGIAVDPLSESYWASLKWRRRRHSTTARTRDHRGITAAATFTTSP